MIFEGEDEVKLQYLTSGMTASRRSAKLTYDTWQRFFDEGDDSRSGCVIKAFVG